MFFPEQKIIFIHAHKTAGNYISRCFVRFSDDHQVIKPDSHQILSDRFNLQGPVTECKHQSLSEYQKRLGGRLDGYRVFTSIRPAVERLMSLYFSPHQWMHRFPDGTFRPKRKKIQFEEARFIRLIERIPSISQLLDAKNFTSPMNGLAPISHRSGATILLMPFDDIENQCRQFALNEGFENTDFPDRAVNVSLKPTLKARLLKQDRDHLNDLVNATHHVKDHVFFQKT